MAFVKYSQVSLEAVEGEIPEWLKAAEAQKQEDERIKSEIAANESKDRER